MEFLFVVTTPDAIHILAPLARACQRQGVGWACFFTNDGVRVLEQEKLRTIILDATRAVACEYSWEKFRAGHTCPIELGSQTDGSLMIGEADKVVSL